MLSLPGVSQRNASVDRSALTWPSVPVILRVWVPGVIVPPPPLPVLAESGRVRIADMKKRSDGACHPLLKDSCKGDGSHWRKVACEACRSSYGVRCPAAAVVNRESDRVLAGDRIEIAQRRQIGIHLR